MSIGTRVRQARQHAGLSQGDLAIAIGVRQASISELETRPAASSKHLVKIAQLCGVSPVWLATGEGKMLDGNTEPLLDSSISIATSSVRAVPLLSWVQAGAFREVISDMSAAKEYYYCGDPCSDQTYALRVEGESMMDRFRPGQIIFVDPEKAPSSGEFVIALLEDSNRATFKQFIIDGGDTYLKALNKDWPERIIRVNENCRVIGTVVGIYESLHR